MLRKVASLLSLRRCLELKLYFDNGGLAEILVLWIQIRILSDSKLLVGSELGILISDPDPGSSGSALNGKLIKFTICQQIAELKKSHIFPKNSPKSLKL